MSEPRRDDATPPPSAEPTRPVQPPPLPGRAVRAQLASGELATPPVRPDEPTVHLDGPVPRDPDRTLELDGTLRTGVTVGPRPGRRRRTWPWILAVVLALVVLGAVLGVMMWRGATIDGDVQFLGVHLRVDGDLAGWSGGAALG
ncbi:hypothetical protein ACU610_01170 [Geodermatophilus sp. URMC 61]|uniref:hypothetical protein n=1 Tax=Geodermatophilus sp. URMC 61 TaxID=3423411 RepID=UPI00406C2311